MTWRKNLFIVAYLIIQLALPLRGFLYDRFESSAFFTWNMYSNLYLCQHQYRLETPEGETRWLTHEDYFNRPFISMRVFFADVLPEFHRWLCEKYRRQGELENLRGYAICSVNNGPVLKLIDRNVDLCAAPNYGVRVQREAGNK